MAKAKAHGGPTVYTKATTPDWDGYYARDMTRQQDNWIWGDKNQMPTILSLLTPKYQARLVQMHYHEIVNNAPQWNASFCYPEGYLRWWARASFAGNWQLQVTPYNVQFMSGIADNFFRQVLIGQTHVQKIRQWYGETVGFWDGDTLVTYTANIQGWSQHTMFEYSDALEAIEIFTPAKDKDGKVLGIDTEVVLYDPEALVQPVRMVDHHVKIAGPADPEKRITYVRCLTNVRNVNGKPTQLGEGDEGFVDYYGRPWAKVWEKYFEQGWDKPEEDELPADIGDLFK
jgi:uncharacterized protein YukE